MTALFLPDTTGLDLKEQERRWAYIRAGREKEYHGIAVHPQHLSMWERLRGVGKSYNAELDYQSKIADMREEWESKQNETYKKGEEIDDYDEYSDDVHTYFRGTSKASPLMTPRNGNHSDSSGVVSNEKVGHEDV